MLAFQLVAVIILPAPIAASTTLAGAFADGH
jgi:hypothetical protein